MFIQFIFIFYKSKVHISLLYKEKKNSVFKPEADPRRWNKAKEVLSGIKPFHSRKLQHFIMQYYVIMHYATKYFNSKHAQF